MIIDFSDFNSFINISITVLPNKTDIKVDSFLKCMTEANINTLIIGNSINYIFKNQPKPHCPMLDIPTKQKVIQTLK